MDWILFPVSVVLNIGLGVWLAITLEGKSHFRRLYEMEGSERRLTKRERDGAIARLTQLEKSMKE